MLRRTPFRRKKKPAADPIPGAKIRKRIPDLKKSLEKSLDKLFSLYIRLRDTDENGYFKCPTCGRILPWEKADCSHYWSRKHKSTRWNEDNCVAECSYCNRFDSSHLDGLGRFLKKKLGEQRFEMLHWLHNQPKKYSEFELAELVKMYRKKIVELKRTKNFIVK